MAQSRALKSLKETVSPGRPTGQFTGPSAELPGGGAPAPSGIEPLAEGIEEASAKHKAKKKEEAAKKPSFGVAAGPVGGAVPKAGSGKGAGSISKSVKAIFRRS